MTTQIFLNRMSFIFSLLLFSTSHAQITWEKYESNPVFPIGSPGAWDDSISVVTSIIVQNDTFKTWYEGNHGFGYATSLDGISWTKDPRNPIVLPGDDGAWDDDGIFMPSVVFHNNMYKMWYSGEDGQSSRIGHATSSDGITWTKHPSNPVIGLGTAGEWDDHEVFHGSVMFDQGIFKIWYNGHNGTLQRTGYATSSDGIVWAKSPSNPVMASDPDGSWDDSELGPMSVLYHNDTYHMWYTATDDTTYQIGYATSPNGIAWIKYEGNPVLDRDTSNAWEAGAVAAPSILYHDSMFKMWYGGIDEEFLLIQGGHATSPDVTFIEQDERRLRPERFALEKNYPNPFNPTTTINYELPITNYVELNVFNVLGQKIVSLVSENQAAGSYKIEWDATGFASGIYYYRLEAGDFVSTRKLILLK